MKSSTGSRRSRSETAALRTSRANGDAKSTGNRLECGMQKLLERLTVMNGGRMEGGAGRRTRMSGTEEGRGGLSHF